MLADRLSLGLRPHQGRCDALYVVMPRHEQGLAVGTNELPQLPSSVRTVIAPATTTLARPFQDWIETRHDLDVVPTGMTNFQITVRKEPTL